MSYDYSRVNTGWPTKLPELDPLEAISAAKRLYRRAMGKPFKGGFKITSGNRFTWIRRGIFYVNPDRFAHTGRQGWADLVHDISHYAHARLNPSAPAHGSLHRGIEHDLVGYAVSSGFLAGKLKRKVKPAPTVADKTSAKLASMRKRAKAWETKRKRADTALRKLRADIARAERALQKAA